MPLDFTQNTLLTEDTVTAVDLERMQAPAVLVRPKRQTDREIRDARRRKTAADAIAGLTRDLEIYGFTKGYFSLLDLMIAALDITGPARVTLSTWTAARNEIQKLAELSAAGRLLSIRFLLDFSFARRDPEAAYAVRTSFGANAVRIAQNHSKFALFENDTWRLVLRTSMNLNMNPRYEDFTLAHDPPLADFLTTLLDEVWARQPSKLIDERPKTITRFFADEM